MKPNKNKNYNNQNRNQNNNGGKKGKEKMSARTAGFIKEFTTANNKKRNDAPKKRTLSGFFEEIKRAKDYKFPLEDVIVDYTNDIFMFFFRESHRDREQTEKLFKVLAKKGMAKAFKSLSKDSDRYSLPVEYCAIIDALIRTSNSENSEVKLSDKDIEIYTDVLKTIFKKPIKTLVKKTKIDDKELLKDLFVMVPSPKVSFSLRTDRKKDTTEFSTPAALNASRRLVRKLITKAQQGNPTVLSLDKKKIDKLFESIMTGFTTPFIAITILMERTHNNPTPEIAKFLDELFSFALSTFESAGKDELRAMFEIYLEQRKYQQKNNQGNLDSKHIKLSEVDASIYPRLVKRMSKLVGKNPELGIYFK